MSYYRPRALQQDDGTMAMSERTQRALQRWPDVPDVYGWMMLDRQGQWLIRGETISRPQIIDTINAHYLADERGCWYFQNGPQRGFVALAYMPLVLRSEPDGGLRTHTGKAVQRIDRAALDEEGALLLECEHGPALLDERDLDWALERLHLDGTELDEPALAAALAQGHGSRTPLHLRFGDAEVQVERIDAAQAEAAFTYVREPAPESDAAPSSEPRRK